MPLKKNDFADLVGEILPFYGCYGYEWEPNTVFKPVHEFKLHDTVFKAIADEVDTPYGLSSCMTSIVKVESARAFTRQPLAEVWVKEHCSALFQGYRLVDARTRHVWLEFGTSYIDDLCASFRFKYQAG